MDNTINQCRLLNYNRLSLISEVSAEKYKSADPFPHIIIDDFLPCDIVAKLAARFPPPRNKPGQGKNSAKMNDGRPAQHNKLWQSREAGLDIAIRRLCWELNSGTFIRFLEELTGIKRLLPDVHMLGGGAHQTLPGGFLKVHADFNKHPETHLDRRLNLLIYLNEDWKESYGGHLELWPANMSACAVKILPIAGRCVIFNTTQTSYHGHPIPLTCPSNRTRKSIALYYYSLGRPAHEQSDPVGTVWKDTSD